MKVAFNKDVYVYKRIERKKYRKRRNKLSSYIMLLIF